MSSRHLPDWSGGKLADLEARVRRLERGRSNQPMPVQLAPNPALDPGLPVDSNDWTTVFYADVPVVNGPALSLDMAVNVPGGTTGEIWAIFGTQTAPVKTVSAGSSTYTLDWIHGLKLGDPSTLHLQVRRTSGTGIIRVWQPAPVLLGAVGPASI